jgi:hypothetical protein
MNRHRLLVSIASACAVAALWAQEPPRPPAPPVAPVTVASSEKPAPPPAPPTPPALAAAVAEDLARVEAELAPGSVLEEMRTAQKHALEDQARALAEHAARLDAGFASGLSEEKAARMRARIDAFAVLAQARPAAPAHGVAPTPPTPPTPPMHPGKRRTESPERAYERGQRALDGRRWTEALEAFTLAASKSGSRAEGAAYWKAYALNKLGRREEALEAVGELRKSSPSSRWLEDAKILEAEIRQASGQPVRPEAETDDDIKLLALNGLIQSEPERAIPLLENLLRSSHAPRLKERALFVLAQSNSPRGKQLLEQVARGGAGNPDMQLKAVRYLGAAGRKGENSALLWEIYSGAADIDVRRAAVAGFGAARDKERLLQIVRTEKSPELRLEAIGMLGAAGSQDELWQIYQQESSSEVKLRILESMHAAGNAERLLEIARTEKDAALRRGAIRSLTGMKADRIGDALTPLYGAETETKVKAAILDVLHAQNNAKALVELARKENDPKLKREIVSRLSHMKSKEASEYLVELLK